MDREKVIKGIQECDLNGGLIGNCPYKGILALLKEQEAVEPFHKCIGKDFSLIEDSHFDYCPYCGKPITWAKQEGL